MMDFKEWETRFYGSLLALLRPAIGGMMNVTSTGFTFGGYAVHVKEQKAKCVIWMVEDVRGASAVDAMKWYASLADTDPYIIASEVANWLRPRIVSD